MHGILEKDLCVENTNDLLKIKIQKGTIVQRINIESTTALSIKGGSVLFVLNGRGNIIANVFGLAFRVKKFPKGNLISWHTN